MPEMKVPTDLGLLGEMDLDVGFTYKKNSEGIFVVINYMELPWSSSGLLGLDGQNKLIDHCRNHIMANFDPEE